MREFETGATRNSDDDKLDFEGFDSPAVVKRYAEYMHRHRFQEDGQLRDSDNWQKGIPTDAYMKSLLRHVMDLWLRHRNEEGITDDDLEEVLCAILFNAKGYLFEILRRKSERIDDKPTSVFQQMMEDLDKLDRSGAHAVGWHPYTDWRMGGWADGKASGA